MGFVSEMTDPSRQRRIENALLQLQGFFPWEDPNGDAWIHEDDEGYVMDREEAVSEALRRIEHENGGPL